MKELRNTKQREEVLNAVRTLMYHPTAEEVYLDVSRKNPSISKGVKQTMPNISLGTVYRNLNLLTQLGEISKISMPGSEPDRFDHITEENHHHAFCRCCKRLFDYELDEELHYEGHVIDKDFTVEKSQLILTGICKDCLEKNKE